MTYLDYRNNILSCICNCNDLICQDKKLRKLRKLKRNLKETDRRIDPVLLLLLLFIESGIITFSRPFTGWKWAGLIVIKDYTIF